MSFDDLPENWTDQTVDDPARAGDIIDLIVGDRDRDVGCLGFVLLDHQRRPVQPIVIGEVTEDVDAREFVESFDTILAHLDGGLGGIIFARGRPGSVLLTDGDRRWHQVVIDGCRARRVPLVGAFLATPSTVRSYPGGLELVA